VHSRKLCLQHRRFVCELQRKADHEGGEVVGLIFFPEQESL
jgi:hypothetical protein